MASFCPASQLQRARAASAALHPTRLSRCPCLPPLASASVGAEAAKRMVDKDGYKVLDIRSARDYDSSHITKPALSSFNVPLRTGDTTNPQFTALVSSKLPNKAAKLVVMCQEGGAQSDEAVQLLQGAAYVDVFKLEGGYSGWVEVWTPSGKRRPPPGRWVSTGKEALKSGLNIPGVAESYDEGGNLVAARYAKGGSEQQPPP